MDAALSDFYGSLTPRVQQARLNRARPYLTPELRVLDIGCGLTDLPGSLPLYVGCDRNERVLAESRRRFPSASLYAWDVAAEEPPSTLRDAGPFDVILMLALLEHLDEPWVALERARRLLESKGRLVTTTPHPLGRLPLEIGARIGLLSPHADEEHAELLDRSALRSAGIRAGLALTHYERFLLGFNQLAIFGLP